MTHFSLSKEHMERLIHILLRTPHLSDLEYVFRTHTHTPMNHTHTVNVEQNVAEMVVFLLFCFASSLSSNQLEDEGLKCFLDALPKLKITRCVK